MVTEGLNKNLEAVRGEQSTDSLQKTAVLGTSHIIRKVLQCEAWGLSGGDHRWFKSWSAREKRACDERRHDDDDDDDNNDDNNNNNNNNSL